MEPDKIQLYAIVVGSERTYLCNRYTETNN